MEADPGKARGVNMKKIALALAGTLIVLTVACSQQPKTTSSQSSTSMEQGQTAAPAGAAHNFSGEIMDSMCAGMGGHEQMIQSGKVKNARECTLECVKMGAKFVLYNPATKTTYQLDDQKKPEQFAGEKVTVAGTLDPSTNTIHVENIMAATS
jgi:starvation-inducible outer membrane lipoprotein